MIPEGAFYCVLAAVPMMGVLGWLGGFWFGVTSKRLLGFWIGWAVEEETAEPEKKTAWINVYPHTIHGSQKAANDIAYGSRLACILISWHEGEGL